MRYWPPNMQSKHGEIVFYQEKDGENSFEVRFFEESVWLSLNQMVELFERDKSVISRHLNNIFKSGELKRDAVVAKNATTAADGKTYQVDYYNLDAIISVGYRVNSIRGTQFRIWATSVIKDHLIKGYTVNERRLAEKGLVEMEQTVSLLARTLQRHELVTDQGKAVLEVVTRYAKSWMLLLKYDENQLDLASPTNKKSAGSFKGFDRFTTKFATRLFQTLFSRFTHNYEGSSRFLFSERKAPSKCPSTWQEKLGRTKALLHPSVEGESPVFTSR